MIRHTWIGPIASLLMASVALITGFACVNPSAFAQVAKMPEPAYAAAMDKAKIMDIQIIADETEWANMLENATAEEYIPATVVINGTKIKSAGIRPKGNSSLSMVAQDGTTDRFSFKIEFDHYIAGQTWLGLDKLAVNNMQGDATYMKEYLSYDIMEYVGVASPLYAFTDISVNGEAWGFYLAVECLEDSYANRVYGNDHGKLYKPESMGMRGGGRMNEFIEGIQKNSAGGQETLAAQEQPGGMQVIAKSGPPAREREGDGGGMGGMASNGVSLQYTGNELSSYSAIFENSVFKATENDYKRVIKALEKLSKGGDLEDTVQVKAVLQYFAAHTVVVNLDSYVSNMGHNYYLYEDDGQLTILPWDYNLAFGGFQPGNASDIVNFPIDTPVSGVSLEDRPLLGRLLEAPEYMELYHGYLQQIVDGYFNSGLFEQTMDSLSALISSHVEADPTAFYDYGAYAAAVAELKKLGLLRAESIEGQLNGAIASTSEGQSNDSSGLVDASGIHLSLLGSQGGARGFGGADRGQGGFGGDDNRGEPQGDRQGMDQQAMQRAMEIIQAGGGLSEEQASRLREAGLTDGQIAQAANVARGGGNDVTAGQSPWAGSQRSATVPGFRTSTWASLGICIILLLLGLTFVFFFKRRRHS